MNTQLFIILSNLVVPIITGQILLLYFLYFLIAFPNKIRSYRFFMYFLIGFSLFNFGRPLQLLVGPYPWPLIIVNIRFFLLCTFISPCIMLAANVFRKPGEKLQKKDYFILVIFFLLGLTYVVFNTLGTKDSYIMQKVFSIVIQDNYTPSRLAPFYGREVTIGVQIITGVFILIFSSIMLFKLKRENPWKIFLNHKLFYINVGIIIFAVSFIYGSVFRQWWVYYATSIFTALFFGWSVLKDIKEVYDDFEKLLPYIKEEILNNVLFSASSQNKLKKMLICLKKNENPDTFMIIKTHEDPDQLTADLKSLEKIQKILKQHLAVFLDSQDYLVIPLAGNQLGLLIKLLDKEQQKDPQLLDHLEELSQAIEKEIERNIYIGIGRSYPNLASLHLSYKEAQNALAFAETLKGSPIIHVENIQMDQIKPDYYPVKEKKKLLDCIKVGDKTNLGSTLSEYLQVFEVFIQDRPELMKYHLYELIGSMIDTAIVAGGNKDRLNQMATQYFGDLERFIHMKLLHNWLRRVSSEITTIVSQVYESRSQVLIDKAKNYIQSHLADPHLASKEIANEIFLSRSYFLYLFKKETGQTLMEYVKLLRIERAKELLFKSNKTITDIAFEVGFNNSNHFSNIFSKVVGISALNYRKQWEKNGEDRTPLLS